MILTISHQEKDMWKVELTDGDSVHPEVYKLTAKEALARAAQMLDIDEPIVPQSYPERIEIGEIPKDQVKGE